MDDGCFKNRAIQALASRQAAEAGNGKPKYLDPAGYEFNDAALAEPPESVARRLALSSDYVGTP